MPTQAIYKQSGTSTPPLLDTPNAAGYKYDTADEMFFFGQNAIGIKQGAAQHFHLRTSSDDKTLRLNSRNYTQTSGSSIGMQSKPNQTATTTGDVIGAEFSPRVNDAGGGAIIALKADPVVKDATTTRTVSALRGIEINIDLPNAGSAYTFTNAVCGLRMFPDFGSGHTFSANRPAILLATPNTSDWTHVLEIESAGTAAVVTGGTYTTAEGYLLIDVAGSDYQMPFYTAAD